MRIEFCYPQSLETVCERIRALPRPSSVVTDEVVDYLCRSISYGWEVNYWEQPRLDQEFPLGSSKFGGLPDVQPGWAWPTGGGDYNPPLGFLLQLNFADLDVIAQGYPADGLLSLYWCPNTGTGLAHYTPPGTELERYHGKIPEADCQLVYASADILVTESRWLVPACDLTRDFEEDGWITHPEFVEALEHPDTAYFISQCQTLLRESGRVAPKGRSFLLFSAGRLGSHLSYFDELKDRESRKLLFDIDFWNTPDFGECYTDHHIEYQMSIRHSDLQTLNFKKVETSSLGEG